MLSLKVKKIKSKNLIRIIFYIISTALIGIVHINHLEFILVTLGLFSIFAVARFSYFTIFSFVLWFSFLQEYIATINPLLASGRLMAGLGVPVYDVELFVCTMFFFIVELIVLSQTNVVKEEKELYKRKIVLKRNIAYLFGIAAFLLVLLAYPSLPSFSASLERDQGILPSSLVVPLALLLLAVVLDNMKHGFF